MSKVLFLDVHGPMQPARLHFGETVLYDDDEEYDRFDPVAVDCIKTLVDRTGASIVMNSTTNRHGEDFVSRMFAINGYPEWGSHIHKFWRTSFIGGMSHTPRDLAITMWLKAAELRGETISHYAIIDDTDVNDPDHQVLVDFDNGISVGNMQRAFNLLGGRGGVLPCLL